MARSLRCYTESHISVGSTVEESPVSEEPVEGPLVRLPEDYFRKPSSARLWDYWLGGKGNYANRPRGR